MDIIQRFALEPSDRGIHLAVPTARFYTGSTFREIYTIHLPVGWTRHVDWSDSYRAVWVNEKERSIFTYCEGDLDLTIDATPEDFEARIQSANDYYMGNLYRGVNR